MERKAILLYLENVRDLEVLKKKIEALLQQESDRYQKDLNNFPTTVKKPIIVDENLKLGSGFYTSLVFFSVSLFGSVISGANSDYNKTGWMVSHLASAGLYMFIVVMLISGIAMAFCVSSASDAKKEAIQKNRDNQERYQNAIIAARENQTYINERKKEYEYAKAYYSNQYAKVKAVLSDFYDMNIIPKQFRGASGACYLYDYMSSSRESFQMALISNQIEEGIKRIEAKLDSICSQLSHIIYQQRVIRNENRENVQRQISYNNNMINTLKALENRQANIEEYSRLSANYNEAQALFGLATYLKY